MDMRYSTVSATASLKDGLILPERKSSKYCRRFAVKRVLQSHLLCTDDTTKTGDEDKNFVSFYSTYYKNAMNIVVTLIFNKKRVI